MTNETALDPLASEAEEHLAIVAMVGRFPGADSVDELWANLVDEVEAVADSPEEDLLAAGVRRETLDDPTYVRRTGRIRGIELFDAAFFGFSPREAALLDPQHRLFLEHCWTALEEAGHDPRRFPGAVGVYGGVSPNGYFFHHLLPTGDLLNTPGVMDAFTGSDKDFLSTRVSYKLGLTGPSISVQTACSTSLVAVHMACQGVLSGECDMALAGGVAVRVPQATGYFYSPSGIMSPDGRCRAYSSEAAGATGGNGIGVVLIRRLSEALADGDPIRAVILGSAINNDGARRVGFAAPSIEGQTAAIVEALAVADVHPDTVGYVEGHGSGTPLGDPIEVSALNAAYRASGSSLRPATTALGSIKTSIGHLDSAAGVAGLIKAALAVERGRVPASLHFERPNPKIDFAAGPFFVADRTIPFPGAGDGGDAPRRAGVSSFGMGGTNAHLVLEEPPEVAPSGPSRPAQLLVLSAATENAVEAACDRLAAHLERHPDVPLPDVAWTLQVGRQVMRHRRALVIGTDSDPVDAATALASRSDLLVGAGERLDRPVAFLLPGLGEHAVGMARGLYEREPVFRAELDGIAARMEPHLGRDLRELLYPENTEPDGSGGGFAALVGRGARRRSSELDDTAFAQPALFAVEVALGRTWLAWGIVPEVVVGYSLGELAAATLAGVFDLDDACRLVALRARWISELPPGAMTAVPLGRDEVSALLEETAGELSIAAVNGPELVVVSGPPEAVAAFEERVAGERDLPCRRLATTHAFHHPTMGRLAGDLGRLLGEMTLSPPTLGWVSTVTGQAMDGAATATDPGHWIRHLTEPVLFERAVETVRQEPTRALLEVGPGASLTSLALQLAPADIQEAPVAVASLGSGTTGDDQRRLLGALGRLWLSGVPVDWHRFAAGERRRRVVLPTYPFQRQRYWVDAVPWALGTATTPALAADPGGEVDAASAAPAAPATMTAMAAHPRPALASPLVAPRDRLEERLAALWSDLLGVAPVGVEDDFFELGGHSLLATRLVARLFRDLGVRLELVTLFDAPTVAGLASTVAELSDTARVERRQPPRAADVATVEGDGEDGENGEDGETIPRRPHPERPAPLSFAQQRIWLLDRMEPESALYNLPFTARLRGPLDMGRLHRALVALARRHEVLRTRFINDGGTPVQVISDDPRAAVPPPSVVDLSGLPAALQGFDIGDAGSGRSVGEALVARPFDLARGPVLRTTLVRLGPEDHLFLAVFHHIAADGWSLGVFARELGALYGGLETPLSALPVQYADFAVWQRRVLSGERLDELVSIWRQRLAGLPPALDLPTDRPRPPVQDIRGDHLRFDVSPELAEALNRRARDEGATLFMLVLAAWGALLARWSGEGTIPVGSPIANRRQVEIEGLIGFFVNTLVLPVEVEPRLAVSDLVERVRGTTLGAYAHQDLPFERLVEALQPQRDLSRTPLFQVMVMLHTTAPLELAVGELTLQGTSVHPGISKFDLMLELTERPEVGLVGGIEYASALFDPVTVERLAGRFRRILRALADGFDGEVAELPLASPEEIGQVLAAGGFGVAPGDDRATDELLHTPVLSWAEQNPRAVAVLEPDGRETTYGELVAEASGLTATLARRGVGPGAVVALVAESDRGTLVAILGVLAAGAAYLPLDLSYPEERLRFMLADSGARHLVAPAGKQTGDARRLASSAGVEVVEAEGQGVAGAVPTPPGSGAYLLYTSGSTGRPKGVLMPHRTIRRLVDWQVERSRRGGDGGDGVPRRTLQAAPLGFDVSCQEIFSTWAAGGTLVLPPPGLRRDPGELLAFLAEHRIERLFLPFVALAQLAEVAPRVLAAPAEREGAGTVGDVLAGCLTEIVTSGEQLRSEPAVRAFFERLSATGLDNQYGPTESHVVTAEAVREPAGSPGSEAGSGADPAAWPELPPIGRPAAGALVAVVDPLTFAPLPTGFVGELVLGSQLAAGYLGRPGMTASRFVPDSLSGRPGERLYRTGDLARWRRDHRLEFLGRGDRQVKIRGYRIEPAEVEVALVADPAVAAAAVVPVPGPGGALRLAAAVVLASNTSLDEALPEIKRRLTERLPSFMVPTVFEVVESLPRTPTGKLDRSAVAAALAGSSAAFAGAGAARPPYEAPRGEHEALVADAFAAILELPAPPGRDDDFFELGGHSLLATRLVARLYDELGVEVPLRTVFERPTVAGLAETVLGRGLDEVDEPDLDRLLAELDDLSDEEAERLLAGTLANPPSADPEGEDP